MMLSLRFSIVVIKILYAPPGIMQGKGENHDGIHHIKNQAADHEIGGLSYG
jgi:hypothetical protein